jgi:NTE family protein
LEGRATTRTPRYGRLVSLLSPRAAETPLARLFVGPRRARGADQMTLPGGRALFEAGDEADCLYFLLAGRLGVIRRRDGQEPRFLGVIRPGEPAGEMAMIAGTPHTADVVALRDSIVLSLPRQAFLKAVRQTPSVMSELAHLMITRARADGVSGAGEPSAFGLIGACPGSGVRALAESLAAEVRKLGPRCAVVGSDGLTRTAEWFTELEDAHELVLYAAECDDHAWKSVVARQVDHLFRIGMGGEAPPSEPLSYAADPLQQQRLVDLILVQPAGATIPRGTDAWLAAHPVRRLFHIRAGDRADLQRIARIITGRSVGLVLSGGGARAYAHIGAIKALRDAHVPFDFIGGVSMGAIVGGGLALGWDEDEMDARIRKAFVDSSPLDDIAFPMIALTKGRKVEVRLAEHFGDTRIQDLWTPFFCVSSDLTAGSYRLHRSGLLRHALRASVSLPGVLPPVSEDGHVLVDGAVTTNFPTDIMRAEHRGAVVGSDVSLASGITAEDVKTPPLLHWLLSGAWRRGPPIVSVLMRSATIRGRAEMLLARQNADLVIAPQLSGIEIRNWKAYDEAVDAGYTAAVKALDALETPITQLRSRRTRQAEAAEADLIAAR